MRLNYFNCKHFKGCQYKNDCIFKAPDKPIMDNSILFNDVVYKCLEFSEEYINSYLLQMLDTEAFRHNFARYLFNFVKFDKNIRLISGPNNVNLYYIPEFDTFRFDETEIDSYRILKVDYNKAALKKAVTQYTDTTYGKKDKNLLRNEVIKIANYFFIKYLKQASTKRLF